MPDLLPGQAGCASVGDRVDQLLFTASASDDGALEEVLLERDVGGMFGIEVVEALGEFVGVVEDVLD